MGIRDRLALPDAEAWRPEAGDEIVGQVIGIEERGTDEYGEYPCIVIQEFDENDELTDSLKAVHAFHSVLRNEVAKLEPKPGDSIAIQFRGEKANAKGTKYANYKVVLERGDGSTTVDWTKHQEQAQAELNATDQEPF